MQIDITQVWEYEFKPTDTMRLLHAFKNHWELAGDEITLERRSDRIFAVRREGGKEDERLLDKVFGKNPLDDFPSIRKD
jgi:hypothetical protein